MTKPERRYILHADLDAFYASVEQLDNTAYRGKPLVVGGSPSGRGVVAAASYEARKYGVHSAMPMATALRLCPELVRVDARFGRYREVSGRVMDIFKLLTPLVEPLSLDEAYLDIGRQVPVDTVDEVASGLKATVREETGLVITVGGGTCKTVAKIASQVAKPDGLLLIGPGRERAFLDPLAVDLLWGVGPKTSAVLKAQGLKTIGDVANCDEAWLWQTLGKRGPELRNRALGRDRDPVQPHRETKSVSAETTLPRDVADVDVLTRTIDEQARQVVRRLHKEGLKGKTISVKLRLADFTTFTRQRTVVAPTDDEHAIGRLARELLYRELKPGRRFRLVGVGVSNFHEEAQLSLFSSP